VGDEDFACFAFVVVVEEQEAAAGWVEERAEMPGVLEEERLGVGRVGSAVGCSALG
jgi:hypothetical protein